MLVQKFRQFISCNFSPKHRAPHIGNLSIDIQNLVKTYPNQLVALDNVSLSIQKGDFFALLGPNGAGKSTIIGIISTLINKASGKVFINGYDLDTQPMLAKQKMGVVNQDINFSINHTCLQIVINQAGYYGVPRADAIKMAKYLFSKLGLSKHTYKRAGSLSGGMKRRLMIARAMAHSPDILILDEPTAGVDVTLRKEMWEFLVEENRKGLTIILTTHYLEEAEQLCRNIAFLDHGKIIQNTTMQEFLKQLDSEAIIIETIESLPELFSLNGLDIKVLEKNKFEVNLQKNTDLQIIINGLQQKNIQIYRINQKSNRLESLFLKLVGEICD